MKNLHYMATILWCLSTIPLSIAQNTQVESTYEQRLYHLGKVWGYVKYFHPEIASCQLEWDKALIEIIPSIKDAPSDKAFNDLLIELIETAGSIEEATRPVKVIAEEYRYNLNLDWFEDPIFSTTTKEHLIQLRDNFQTRNHCLLKEAFAGGNPTFEKDNWLYEKSGSYPTEAQRILAIFRYWNAINYFFPYKYQMDQDWDSTFQQFIPSVLWASNAQDYHLSLKEMTTYINDSHAFFSSDPYGKWVGYYFAPFRVKFVENQTVITKVHSSVSDKIKVGDVITVIDREPIATVRNRIRKYIGASNKPTEERNINSNIVRGEQGAFEIKTQNDKEEKTVELERVSYNSLRSLFDNDREEAFQRMVAKGGCNVGYIDMDLLTPEQVPLMFQAFNELPAIVVDIRNYPQGTLWHMVDYLYSGPINFSAFTQPNIRYPGTLNFYQHSIGEGGVPYQGRLILLFNEDTQSQAEFTVMGLELHPNSIKIGSQTAGADGNISTLYLPGGIRTVFTGLGVFYPDGTETQRIGMVPDIEFHPTVQGIREGRDEMLEFALDCKLIGVDIPEVMSENGVDVFPNPVHNNLILNTTYGEGYSIQVTDVLGRFIEGFTINSSLYNYSLDVSSYNAGTYFLIFRNQEGIFATKKVVKL